MLPPPTTTIASDDDSTIMDDCCQVLSDSDGEATDQYNPFNENDEESSIDEENESCLDENEMLEDDHNFMETFFDDQISHEINDDISAMKIIHSINK